MPGSPQVTPALLPAEASPAAVVDRTPPPSFTPRLVSLDTLRGFDMFWIMGGDMILRSLPKIHDSAFTRALAGQMEHCEWAGFHFYDLIFPLFVFVVGVSLVFSIGRMLERSGRLVTLKRIFIRSVVLFLLGIFYMGGISNGFKNIYFAGVLHRIAVAYFFTAIVFVAVHPLLGERAGVRGTATSDNQRFMRKLPRLPNNRFGLLILITLCAFLLIGYWILMTFVSVPGIGAPSLAGPGKNLAHYIDDLYLPGRRFEGTLLSTMAAVANCLLGVFAGLLLKNSDLPNQKKVYWLLADGALCLAVGFLWSLQFPIIKLLWTSSYVLVACGYSAILLAIFVQIIEIWNFRRWAQPFVWLGMNAITIYITANVANFQRLALRFVGGDVRALLGNYADLAQAILATAFAFCVVSFLYRRKIFLRL
jgi:predicted acyltransferase